MIFFKFILWFLLSEAIIIGVRFLLRNKEISLGWQIGITVGEFLVSILMAFLPMAGPMAFRPLHPFMMAMYVALMMDSVAMAIYLIVNKYGKSQKGWIFLTAISLILGISGILFIYSISNFFERITLFRFFFSFFGKRSLFYLGMHLPVLRYIGFHFIERMLPNGLIAFVPVIRYFVVIIILTGCAICLQFIPVNSHMRRFFIMLGLK